MCSLYISYNRYHGVFRKVLFVVVLFLSRLVHADAMHATLAALCSGRDSCMLTSRCMLPWLRSAPYPALCPCEPLGPVGDMQAVSYGARSRQYIQSTAPGLQLVTSMHVSSSDHALGPWVGFMYIYYHAMLLT